jgi:hypothetical protein
VSVTVVNGYLCTTCSEAAKARSGQNPHAPSPTNPSSNTSSDPAQTPAVVYGGSLSGQNAVAPTNGANGPTPAMLDVRA